MKLTHRDLTILKHVCPGRSALALQVHSQDPGIAAGHSMGGSCAPSQVGGLCCGVGESN